MITWQELMMQPEPIPEGVHYPRGRKCQRCGRFCKTLTMVWTGYPEPELDYEVGECCKDKR